MSAPSRWMSGALILVLVLVTRETGAFLLDHLYHLDAHASHGHGHANSTILHLLRMVKQCLVHFEVPHAGPAATAPWMPPYPEPPPTSVELCALRGFQCERHDVWTADGYALAVIHVVGRLGAPPAAAGTRAPVLVQHGMLMSSDAFLFRADDDGNLPLFLSDAGYDVWVGNYRGNAVSPHVHATLSPDSQQFWNFSWHEMGLNDLPAMVDHVLQQASAPDLFYIGHSMGSTGMMVLLSSRPEYNRKVRLASFLAPVAFVSTLRSRLFRQLFAIAPGIKAFLLAHRVWNVLPRSAALHRFVDKLCLFPGAGELLCDPVAFEIAGRSPEHVFPYYVPTLLAYLPAGTTIRILEHYYELARTGKFRPLGYGTGDPNPGPEYNISAITAPVALYYSQNDYFVHPPDVDRLAAKLPHLFHKFKVPDATFNHFDFLLGRDGKHLLYTEVLAMMRLKEAEGAGEHNQLAPLSSPLHLRLRNT
ncbi:Lipase 1 [Frankliniella fusca]|uniref:Lipase 1 n=1 Tax=Frankliniella fusca TaxID=407009 RepID=A0AAE1HAF4_9NEOP|nr:Lipase 1 [Frankliniella fusca]